MLVITRWYGVSSEVPPPLALEQVRGISPLCGAINVPLLERINMKTGAKRLIRWSFCRQIVQESLASNFHQKKNRIGSIGIDLSTKKRTCSQTSKAFITSSRLIFRCFPVHLQCSMLCSVTTVCAVLASRLFWDFQRHLVEK